MANVGVSVTVSRYSQEYWEDFYGDRASSLTPSPSAFAQEVATSLSDRQMLLELGSGSGRDFHLLRKHCGRSLATDASHAAVKMVRNALEAEQCEVASAEVFDVESAEDRDFLRTVLEEWRQSFDMPFVFYARFFLHAIPLEAERHLLEWSWETLRPGEVFHLEYRAAEIDGEYTFGRHYRRPVDPASVEELARLVGFSDAASRTSNDFARYGSERPLVARTRLVR